LVGITPMKVKGTTAPIRRAATAAGAEHPASQASQTAHEPQWRLHPGRTLVAYVPLPGRVPRVERHARRVLDQIHVQRCTGEQGSRAASDKPQDDQGPLCAKPYPLGAWLRSNSASLPCRNAAEVTMVPSGRRIWYGLPLTEDCVAQ
jgi:hypothetical protein